MPFKRIRVKVEFRLGFSGFVSFSILATKKLCDGRVAGDMNVIFPNVD